MKKIFREISSSYFKNAFSCMGYALFKAPLLLKLPLFVFSVIEALALSVIGIIFGFLVIFDFIAILADKVKKLFFEMLDNQKSQVNAGFFSFLIRPLLVILLIPLLIFITVLSSLSPNIAIDVAGELSNVFYGEGAMKKLVSILKGVIQKIFKYSLSAPLYVMPIYLVITLAYVSILLPLLIVFTVLIPLDWLSEFTERSHIRLTNYLKKQSSSIRYGGVISFVFRPTMLFVFAPILLAVLLVPKFLPHFLVD